MNPITSFRSSLPVLAICLIALVAGRSGLFAKFDHFILDLRMASSERPASEEYVFVAIDTKSLEGVGVWPWPRSLYADMLDALVAAGASDIFIDVDFAYPTDPTEDRALQQALERAGGATLLPVFVQDRSSRPASPQNMSQNRPLEAFANQSWPALVNVSPDEDGTVRTYPFGRVLDGEYVSSAASLMAGVFDNSETYFFINFAIEPQSIPFVSVIDVLNDRIPTELFLGRTVVIGAHALELRDSFAVPVHGNLSGSMVHILATETLKQKIVPVWISEFVVFLTLLAMLFLLNFKKLHDRPWVLIAAITSAISVTEIAGLYLFVGSAIVLPSGALIFSLLVFGFWRISQSLNLSTWLVQYKQVQIDNSRNLLHQVFSDSSDIILVIDADGKILTSSANAKSVLPHSGNSITALPEELMNAARTAILDLGMGRWEKTPPQDLVIASGDTRRILQYTVTPSSLAQQKHSQKRRSADRYIATISARDITQLHLQSEHLDYFSKHDERTGALRRSEFLRLLEEQLVTAPRVSVFAINLHRFKTINATLGREVGDELLKSMVERLQDLRMGLSQVVRLDGDSFALFSRRKIDTAKAEELAESIATVVSRIYHLGDTTAQVGVRIGYVCPNPAGATSAQELLSQAEQALDDARHKVGTQIRAYDPAGSKAQTRAKTVERAMWDAIERQEFYLVYQPQLNMIDKTLFGIEALLRWNSTSLGAVYPDEFIGIAESNGFIADLGRWVLDQSCRDAMRLPVDVSLSVNVSAAQMWNASIKEDVENALFKSGLAPSRLCLELTESVFLSPSEEVVETMSKLRMLGVTWALDDFGTGYSSLGYLSKLPLDKIKLDKQFAQTLDRDPNSLAVVRSVVELSKGIGVNLLCEGVETEQQAEILISEGCIEGQGYLYSQPKRLDELVTSFDLVPSRGKHSTLRSSV